MPIVGPLQGGPLKGLFIEGTIHQEMEAEGIYKGVARR